MLCEGKESRADMGTAINTTTGFGSWLRGLRTNRHSRRRLGHGADRSCHPCYGPRYPCLGVRKPDGMVMAWMVMAEGHLRVPLFRHQSCPASA